MCHLRQMTNVVVTWIVSMMVFLAPPEKLAAVPQLPGWHETADQKLARYHEIAQALYDVTYDEKKDPLYMGPKARANTTATLLAIAFMESGFARDVDLGPCYRGRGFAARCDGGNSAGMMQFKLGEGTTAGPIHGIEGKTQKDIFADRRLMFGIGLHMVRRSMKACRKYGEDWGLNVYASGTCVRRAAVAKDANGRAIFQEQPTGLQHGRARLRLARKLLERLPPPVADRDQHLVPADPGPREQVSLLAPQ